jgi:cytochrome c oxidase subunit II
MIGHHRARGLAATLPLVVAFGLTACAKDFPNTIFGAHSELGRAVDGLNMRLLILGAIVFVLVETLLILAVFKFRSRPGHTEAAQTHGNTTLEVTWTLIPAVILAFIAVPTVKTIFQTQATAVPNALQLEVIGHQWWWEFRYPQYNVVTANELYLPVGRTVNATLKSADVIHSFWIPNLAGGKRDAVSNHANHLWFTPDSSYAWNGFCAEYCGASHANMQFKVFTVTPAEFDAYIKHQQTGPAFGAAPPAPGAPAAGADTGKKAPPVSRVATSTGATTPAGEKAKPPVATPVMGAGGTATYPRDKLPKWVVPETPVPAGVTVSTTSGDPARGAQLFRTGACIGCHTVQGVSPGIIGPNLTHVGSRTTIGGGLYPNDMKHLTLWIKNAPVMKPGSLMPAMGKGLPHAMGAYDDQQIADIAAYLTSLK